MLSGNYFDYKSILPATNYPWDLERRQHLR